MSLQVWLPLIKDATNQGLCGNSLITSGVTFSDGGKLGGKYLSAGTITIPAAVSKNIFNKNNMSFAFWLYPIGTSSSAIIMGQNAMSAGNNRMYSIFQYSTPNNLHLSWQDETSSTTFLGSIDTGFFTADTWTHCCITYNGSVATVYRNGVLYSTHNGTSNRAVFEYDYPITGGTLRKLQDVRIYDHCLSPIEVKKLAQGLVLHYPLNRQCWGQENLAHNTYNLAPFSTVEVEFKAYDVGLLDVSNGEQITISFDLDMTVATGGAGYLQVYNTNYPGPHQITAGNALAGRTLVAGQDIHERISYTTTMITRSSSSYSTDRIEFYSNYSTENEIQISNIKIERGSIATPWCPNIEDDDNMGINSSTEYDISGFGNNGTRIGNLSWSSDTPKYTVSTYFEDYTKYISGNMGDSWIPDAITMSCWIKGTNKSARGGYHLPLNMHSTNFEISITGSSGKARMGFLIGGTRYVSDIGSDILNGQWHMLTLTYNGSQICRYVDGVLINSENRTGALTSASTLGIGQFPGQTTYGNTQLYESDVRIYATALSADDIADLYHGF